MPLIKIDFIITSLGAGGAQLMLLKLNSLLDRGTFAPRVIALAERDQTADWFAERFREIDVPVVNLSMRRGIPDPRGIASLRREIRTRRPQLVQTWMYHADLLGGIGARLFGNAPLVWNLRNSNLDPETSKRSTVLVARICARLSHFLPRRIVCCSKAAEAIHVRMGYDRSKMVFIPNGFDLTTFRPDPEARNNFRRAENIPESAVVIGYAARFDPQKDHRGFLQAAAKLKEVCPEVVFALCGDGVSLENRELCGWLEEFQLSAAVRLLGRRQDMPQVMASFDIHTSASSYGEAFSNAVGESMACAVPCVVTDVGDSAMIVGDTGKVVPIRNPQALAANWHELIMLGKDARLALGMRARQRVQQEFSLDRVAKKYEELYMDILR